MTFFADYTFLSSGLRLKMFRDGNADLNVVTVVAIIVVSLALTCKAEITYNPLLSAKPT